MSEPLDNPFWSALRSLHRDLAVQQGRVARYPADVAPFLGVATEDDDVAEALETLVAPEESVYLLGVAPRKAIGFGADSRFDLRR
jgi:hypothetical protein